MGDKEKKPVQITNDKISQTVIKNIEMKKRVADVFFVLVVCIGKWSPVVVSVFSTLDSFSYNELEQN